MHRLAQWFTSFAKKLFFNNDKSDNRLLHYITGLFFLVILHFFVGIVLFFSLHASVTKVDRQFEADLKLSNLIKDDLTSLASELDLSASTLNRVVNFVNQLSADTRTEQNWKLIQVSLTNLLKVVSNPENGRNNQEIDDGLIKSQVLIDGLIRILIEKRQNLNDRLFSKVIIFEAGSILITIILFCIGTMLLNKNLKKQQTELAYFESLAYQFKGGQLDKIQFNYQGNGLTDFNQIIISYIQLLKERYQAVKEQIKKFNFQINEISLFSKQNNTFYTEIKRDLGNLVEQNYGQVAKYQMLAERIKSLNNKLVDSQAQISMLHESLKNGAKVFQEAPEEIKVIGIKVKKREQYLKKVAGDLYQLRSLLERLLQTGSIFQNVAEQNTLLALNASIEAARAENTGEGFDIAAEEIARLAEKIGRVSKELLAVVDTMGANGNTALKTLEIDLARNNEVKRFIEAVGNKINIFCLKLSQLIEETIQYSIQLEELDDKRKSLEELAASLGEINQRSENYFGRAEAALDVLEKSGQNLSATEQLDPIISGLRHLMNKIAT